MTFLPTMHFPHHCDNVIIAWRLLIVNASSCHLQSLSLGHSPDKQNHLQHEPWTCATFLFSCAANEYESSRRNKIGWGNSIAIGYLGKLHHYLNEWLPSPISSHEPRYCVISMRKKTIQLIRILQSKGDKQLMMVSCFWNLCFLCFQY